ncbi:MULTISPECIES: glutathione binding-like protein [Asaia]|uniref:Glutathione S-transferase n=1 Tax=Asaia bogorensis TaxID=91915 RepID=A0A060QJQ2_9PROT|nr:MULTISPECIES: glutathione binding-like protein [Asaia]ETC99802.1 GSH-dependent disulfide bond oxidoreductase [Asaia sp. SF2.1]CDG39491.1 Glutathione S-transferase [Asaia bogorensis]
MIDLYYWPTPNGHKITLFLEEAGLDYRIIPVNISKGDQFAPAFLKISPNNKMPAIVDHAPADGGEPISVFESGEILLYLAEKTGLFLSSAPREKIKTLEWLFWQMGGFGPMLGQNHHFTLYAPEKIAYAIKRYQDETKRLYAVLETRLKESAFVSGEQYGIADMATYPWTRTWKEQGIDIGALPAVKAWREIVEARPATQRALARADEVKS